MRRAIEQAITYPRSTLMILALLLLIAAPGVLQLPLRTDGQALVPHEDPVVLLDAEAREHFGLRDPIIVYLTSSHPDGIYNSASLARLRDLTEALQTVTCIGEEHVVSLATERRDRFVPGTPQYRWFLDPLPETVEAFEELRGDIAANALLTGTLISRDGRGAAILAGAPHGHQAIEQGCDDRIALHREIENTIAPFASDQDQISIVGAPVAESLLGIHILEDLTLLVPLAMTLIAVVLWLGCRRFWGVALGMLEVGAAMLWTFGIMGWLGFPVYLTTAVLPVILTAIGLADEIHIFWRYQQILEDNPGMEAEAAVRKTLDEMAKPVIFTSLTSTIGFLSFLASPIEPIRSFGLFAAVGILFCMVFSLTAVPAALRLLPVSALKHPQNKARNQSSPAWLERFFFPALGRRGLTLGLLAVLTLVGAFGTSRLYVQDSWLGGFSPESAFRQATDRVNQDLFGTHILTVHLSFEPPAEVELPRFGPFSGPLLEPEAVERIGQFEEFLRSQPGVGGVQGLHSQLINTRYLQTGRYLGARVVPQDPHDVLLVIRHLESIRGVRRLDELVDDDFSRTMVTVFLKDANYLETERLMASIRTFEEQNFSPLHARLDFTGDVAVSQAMIPAIVDSQVKSLLLALFGAFLTLCVLYRSWLRGLLGVLPACLAVFWVFGAMGWFNIPLGVATSMFCAITLGIGVDHSIHFLARFDRAHRDGHPFPAKLAVKESGPAIIVDTLAVALGFGLLSVSQIPANAWLGGLVALALAASCLLTLLGLGAALHSRTSVTRIAAAAGWMDRKPIFKSRSIQVS